MYFRYQLHSRNHKKTENFILDIFEVKRFTSYGKNYPYERRAALAFPSTTFPVALDPWKCMNNWLHTACSRRHCLICRHISWLIEHNKPDTIAQSYFNLSAHIQLVRRKRGIPWRLASPLEQHRLRKCICRGKQVSWPAVVYRRWRTWRSMPAAAPHRPAAAYGGHTGHFQAFVWGGNA